MARTQADPAVEAKIAERKIQAFELRKAGATLAQIAKQLGVAVSTAHDYVHEVLRERTEQQLKLADEWRAMELEDLASMRLVIDAALRKGNLAAIDRNLKIMDRRAKLLGLDHNNLDITSDGKPIKSYIGWSPDEWAIAQQTLEDKGSDADGD